MRTLAIALSLTVFGCAASQLETAQVRVKSLEQHNVKLQGEVSELRTKVSVAAHENKRLEEKAKEDRENLELLKEQLSDALDAIGKLNTRLDTYDWILVDDTECKNSKLLKERVWGNQKKEEP